MEQSVNETVKDRYQRFKADRDIFLNRARRCAEVTIPTLVPPEGATSSHIYPTPYQSLGARGVNNLAAKLLLVMLPTSSASTVFRLTIAETVLEKLVQAEGMRAEIDQALGRMEREVALKMETAGVRAPMFEGLKYMLVAGNVLLYRARNAKLRLYTLPTFVVKRDPMGDPMEFIALDLVSRMELPERALPLVKTQTTSKNSHQDTVEVYTRCHRDSQRGVWVYYQEIEGREVPGSRGEDPIGKCSFLCLAPLIIPGEDYARSYVEEYLGDLLSLEGGTKSMLQAAAAMSKIIMLVSPNSMTNPQDLNEAESGDFVTGRKDDISALTFEKYPDLQYVEHVVDRLERRLSYAFLLNSAIQRQGERVTAEEIRYMANELESALGGMYTALSQSFQKPFIEATLTAMQKAGELPALPDGVVNVTITTGVDAIGRSQDLAKLDALVEDANAKFGPEVAQLYINVSDYFDRRGTALGIDTKGLVRTEEEVQAIQQQQQQAAMMQALGPEALKQAGAQQQQGAQ